MLNRLNVSAPSRLARIRTLELPNAERYHDAMLALLGINADGQLAVEASYRASENGIDPGDEWIAQFLFAADGTLIECQDEECGRNAAFRPLSLTDFRPPLPVIRDIAEIVDYVGARWRGLRETDRVREVLQPLSVAEKLAMTARELPGPILGIAESRAIAAATLGIDDPHKSRPAFICRRLRIAYAMPVARDVDGLPYDYDTYVLYLAHLIDDTNALPLAPALTEALAPDVVGVRPMDALYDAHSARLYVADGGDAIHPSAVHVLQITTQVQR